MIAGGGTGGHIFPGIAIAEAIEELSPEAEVFFMGRRGSIEERVVSGTRRRFVTVPSMGVIRGAVIRNVAVPFVVAAGCLKAVSALAMKRPDAAVGTGGFASLPPVLAACALGVPIILQEQNSWPGLATRVLSRFAEVVHVTFSESEKHLPRAKRIEHSGNPVRRGFDEIDRAAARRALGLTQEANVVMVMGGSRGARRLSLAVADAMPRLSAAGVEFVIQTGAEELEHVRDRAASVGARAVVDVFFEEIARVYAACDIVVSRAGATTLAETAIVGRPAVLVPYPHATDDHQMKNARSVENTGAAVVIPDGEFTGDRLADTIEGLLRDRTRLTSMSSAARALARPDAADRVARDVLVVASRTRH
jgi:UDP-N-acetylglucosamine--N-acetylmuramyl-(pentapeptide) pyrophosphoryl-undecaprenol N-acetylglucosamine transferase